MDKEFQKFFGKSDLSRNRKWTRIKLDSKKGGRINNKILKKLFGNMTFEQLEIIEKQFKKVINSEVGLCQKVIVQLIKTATYVNFMRSCRSR